MPTKERRQGPRAQVRHRTGPVQALTTMLICLPWAFGAGTVSASSTSTWTTMSVTLNTARDHLGATIGPCPGTTGLATANQCLYAIGGSNFNSTGDLRSVEYYDPSAATPTWTTMSAQLTIARSGLGAATGPCPGTTGLPTDKQCLYAIGDSIPAPTVI